MNKVLKCYISGRHLPGQEKLGLVSFTVPDLGILFRSLAEGARTDLEMIGLFSLLRFASHNQEIFEKHQLVIHTDYHLLAFLMDSSRATAKNLGALRKEAKKIAGDISFRVKAISETENRAVGSACDIPILPDTATLNIKTFSSLTIKNPPDPFALGHDGKSS